MAGRFAGPVALAALAAAGAVATTFVVWRRVANRSPADDAPATAAGPPPPAPAAADLAPAAEAESRGDFAEAQRLAEQAMAALEPGAFDRDRAAAFLSRLKVRQALRAVDEAGSRDDGAAGTALDALTDEELRASGLEPEVTMARRRLAAEAARRRAEATACDGVDLGDEPPLESALDFLSRWPALSALPPDDAARVGPLPAGCARTFAAAAGAVEAAGELDAADLALLVEALVPIVTDGRTVAIDEYTGVGASASAMLRSIAYLRAGGGCRPGPAGSACEREAPMRSWPSDWPAWWSWAKGKTRAAWRMRAIAASRLAARDPSIPLAERRARLDDWMQLDPIPAGLYGVHLACEPTSSADRRDAPAEKLCRQAQQAVRGVLRMTPQKRR